jgi:hypothetical protein
MDPQAQANNKVADPYEYQWKKDYEEDWFIHRQVITNFDALEAMSNGMVFDSVSNSVDTGARITDSYARTLARERANRVMGKLPDGVTEPMGKNDEGKAAFMDIIRQKWLYPNANAQAPFQDKLENWQYYSDVYGYMLMFYDWNVSPSGYVGPDCWLWNPRNLIPQQGRASIADMEYVTALTWYNKTTLEGFKEKGEAGGWDVEALNMLIERATNETTRPDAQRDTYLNRTRTPQAVKRGICLATRYEAGDDGEWITFAPDHGYLEVRRIKNPHKNGRIPFVVKYSERTYDNFYGNGFLQFAKPLQFARDGLDNFYFKGIKMNLIPPIVANANGVLKHTLDYREGGVMLETIPNSIRRLETSTAGLATYQAAKQAMTGSLLGLAGSQNASIPGSEALNPSMGKTPAAISLYGDKEATADGAARNNLERAIEELTDGFFSLIANIGTETIPINLFADDIADIMKSGLTDIKDLFENFQMNESESGGQLKIDPKKLKGIEYRFHINAGSTAKQNQDAQRQALENWRATIGKMQNVIQNDPTIQIDWAQIMKTYAELTSIEGVEDFVKVNPQGQAPPTPPSATSVQMPGGQVHEVADLTKLFLGVTDLGVQNAILQALGLPTMQQPSGGQAPEPNAISTGHVFNDPQIAAAADAVVKHVQTRPAPPEPQPQTPAVTPQGYSFHDPHIAEVATNLLKSAQNSPKPLKEPANGPNRPAKRTHG